MTVTLMVSGFCSGCFQVMPSDGYVESPLMQFKHLPPAYLQSCQTCRSVNG